jgi:hypothetical protein
MRQYLVALARPTRALAAFVLGVAVAVAVLPAPAHAATAQFIKESQWSGGYVGRMTVRNDATTTMTSWRVEFDLPAGTSVIHHWGAQLTPGTTHHVFVNAPWNGTLRPGESTSFGFVASGTAAPMNCIVNGTPCAGGPVERDIAPPTAPANVRATLGSQTFTLSWDPSTDDRGVVAYEVFANGSRIATTTATSYTSPIPPPIVIAYGIRAVDAAGNASTFGFHGAGTPVDTEPPTTPTGLMLGMSGGNIFTLAWTASTDNVMVAGYRVFLNGAEVSRVGNTNAFARFSGGFGEWNFLVCAFDPAGNASGCARAGIAIDPPPPTRPPTPVP